MKHTIFLILLIVLGSCSKEPVVFSTIEQHASLYPEYTSTYIPYNIAPLIFEVREQADKYYISFHAGNESFGLTTKKEVNIPLKKWKKLITGNKNGTLTIRIFAYKNNEWKKYKDLFFSISEEPIDKYIAYRLIEPGYKVWNKVGIYQRCLENFEESPILVNTLTGRGCMNCHSFCNYEPDQMLFHLRGILPGTIIVREGKIEKVSTKQPHTLSEGVYPRWHPGGRYVAFSTNSTAQGFRMAHTNKVEVFDDASDIILYDTQTHTVYTDENMFGDNRMETFPEWSPDGKYLYFCSAEATKIPDNMENLRYDLLRIPFDKSSGTFGHPVDTLINSRLTGKSLAHPRISPDGSQLVFCMFDYGTFPIWHRENDLYSLNLQSGEITCLETINSKESDSYHSWSSNGRWIIFGSRRLDGAYTRLFISYVDKEGKFHPPFLLPQKTADFYDYFLKSYNIPEFIKDKVKVTPHQLNQAARSQTIKAKKR